MWARVASKNVIVRTTELYAEGWNPINVYERFVKGDCLGWILIRLPNEYVLNKVLGLTGLTLNPRYGDNHWVSYKKETKAYRVNLAGSNSGSNIQVTASAYCNGRYTNGDDQLKLVTHKTPSITSTGIDAYNYTKQLTTITSRLSKYNEPYVHANNARLNNTRSFAAAGMSVKTTIKNEKTIPNTQDIQKTVLIGQFNIILEIPQSISDIASTTELYGLRVTADKRKIVGVVAFENIRNITVGLLNGDKINLSVIPTRLERII